VRRYAAVVERIFQGKFQNQVKCLGCHHESNTYDPFLDISLELPHVDSVPAAMELFTEEERLDGDNCYRCSRCKNLCPALKRLTVHEAPAVLVIHLKRFNIFGGKINRNVRFGDEFTLRGHMSASSPVGLALFTHVILQSKHQFIIAQYGLRTQSDTPRECEPYSPEKHGPRYRLYAMVVHAGGSVGSGHYYAFARKPELRARGGGGGQGQGHRGGGGGHAAAAGAGAHRGGWQRGQGHRGGGGDRGGAGDQGWFIFDDSTVGLYSC
jgi:ubiquitin C-terminal hydrolase